MRAKLILSLIGLLFLYHMTDVHNVVVVVAFVVVVLVDKKR